VTDPLLLYPAIGGLAISAFASVLLYFAFRLVGVPLRLTAIYLLFTLTFALLAVGSLDSVYAEAAAIAEALAFFMIYLDYFRKEIALAAVPALAVGSTIAYFFSLYFLVYNSVIILGQRRRERYSIYVFASFVVFGASVVLAMVTLLNVGDDLTTISYLLLDVGVALFFLPLFLLRPTTGARTGV
jgi:hypothetical protein